MFHATSLKMVSASGAAAASQEEKKLDDAEELTMTKCN
jgi:hypothetical protein